MSGPLAVQGHGCSQHPHPEPLPLLTGLQLLHRVGFRPVGGTDVKLEGVLFALLSGRLRAQEGLPAAAPPLTRRWRLELGLLLGVACAEDFRRGLLPTLDLALKGKQVLNILLFQGACCTARSANI